MAEGCRRNQWDHTAALQATVMNSQGGRGNGQAFTGEDFHPFSIATEQEDTRATCIEDIVNFMSPPKLVRPRTIGRRKREAEYGKDAINQSGQGVHGA